MAYIALYRKWRPDSFKNLVGQEHVSRTLSNAITTGRIGHAYLFSGPRGTGKTSTAKILARSLNCDKGPTLEPCGVCENCRKISDGSSMDVYEIDAASNRGIDEIRDLRETVSYAPVLGRYKVYIIDEVHMLTTEAFNALLKTLEEPPAHVVFILATTEAHRVPATIQSRCQRYDFKRITLEDIQGRLQLVADDMGLKAEPDALRLIAQRAEGGMRDALSIMDQCTALSDGDLTRQRVQQLLGLIGGEWVSKLAGAISRGEASAVLGMVADMLTEGKDLQQLLTELTAHFRGVLIFQALGKMEDGSYQGTEDAMREQSKHFSQPQLMAIIRKLHDTMNEVKWSPQPRISVEAALLELCRGEMENGSTAGSFQSVENANNFAGQSGTADSGKLAQLEAKLGQLTALVQQLQSRPVQPAAGNAPVASVAVNDKPKPVEKSAVPRSAGGSEAVPTELQMPADSQTMWHDMLEWLGGSAKACLASANFMGVTDTQFFLSVRSPMVKRMVDSSYRKRMENFIEGRLGAALSIVCTMDDNSPALSRPVKKSAPPPPPPPPEPEIDAEVQEKFHDVTVNVEEIPQNQQNAVQAAVDVFGDHFVEMDKSAMPVMEDVPMPEDEDLNLADEASLLASMDNIPLPDDSEMPEFEEIPIPEDEF